MIRITSINNTALSTFLKLVKWRNDEYKKQINGYKKYIEKVTGKDVYTYLYSIIDNKLLKID